MKKSISIFLAVTMMLSVLCIGVSAKEEESVKEAKNVIIMIGDGMGINHIKWAEQESGKATFMTSSMPYTGWSKTNSWSGTTDSAAGGTAIAAGKHTFNGSVGCIGFDMNDMGVKLCDYKNLCEEAKDLGKKAGILTSDKNSGATPSDFTVHVGNRSLNEEICDQQLAGDFDLIWSAPDDYVTSSMAEAAGYEYVTDLNGVKALKDGSKSFGQFSNEIQHGSDDKTVATLSNLTVEAIDQLNCKDGFFLMVEGAHIDKNSHNNNELLMKQSLYEFDKAVKNAVEFAKKDGNTIVIVTADHETGAISYDEDSKTYKFNDDDHSSTNVPVFVYGTDELVKDGSVVVNVEIGQFAAKKLGSEEGLPVVTFNFSVVADFFKALFNFSLSDIFSD